MAVAALKQCEESDLDLARINDDLAGASAQEIVHWALGLGMRAFATTSFGPNSAVMLHLLSSIDPDIPIVWIDTGYNLRDTYQVADQLINSLPLNLRVYTPQMTAERWNVVNGGVPQLDEPKLHEEFTRKIKLEPFQRALEDIAPDLWLTGIRKEETAYRRDLDIVSCDNRGLLRVAPIFNWSDADVEDYMATHGLPSCRQYFDPTKVSANRECGLQTGA